MVHRKGSFEYEIKIEDESIDIQRTESLEAELAAVLTTLSVVKYTQNVLTKTLGQAKGKDLKKAKYRLYKLTTTELTLTRIADDMAKAIQNTPNEQEA